MSTRFQFKNSKFKKQHQENITEVNFSGEEGISSLNSSNTTKVTRNQNGTKKKRPIIRLSRKHWRKNGKYIHTIYFKPEKESKSKVYSSTEIK